MKWHVIFIPNFFKTFDEICVCVVYGNDKIISINTFTKNCEGIDFVHCALSCQFASSFRVCKLKITLSL